MHKRKLLSITALLLGLLLSSSLVQAQNVNTALQYVRDNAAALGLAPDDVADMAVTDAYISKHTGVTHVYLNQQYQGIGVHNAVINVNVLPDGKVLSVGNRFVPKLASRITSTSAGLSASGAAEAAAGSLGLSFTEPLTVLESTPGPTQETHLSDGGASLEAIPAKLVYQPLENGEVRLAWDVGIYALDAQNYWSIRVDAGSGSVLDQNNLVIHDYWGGPIVPQHDVSPRLAPFAAAVMTPSTPAASQVTSDDYFVFPLPSESPLHPAGPGTPQSTETDPADATASPFGWHDTNGSPGAEFTITRGNNVDAYQDQANSSIPGGPGNAPQPSDPNLHFNVAFNFGIDPTAGTNPAASVINLFYWNNIIHDVQYKYGFDEASGNFQVNNYGNGGLGNDDVRAEGQDGGGNCNANMLTLPDGSRPRMQMYLCNAASPRRDGDLDHGVIIHEYAHGTSNRLTGGPGTTSCLNNTEQMGEGWSDWYGLIMTQQGSDTGPQARGIGTYLFGQAPNGPGIRPRPYSTSFAVNDFTYDNIKTASVPHGIGHVWSTMLWDLNWALIGGDPNFPTIPSGGDDGSGGGSGFDPDFYNGTGGNNLVFQLVTDGMKLQPCNPGFVDGRDAILAADVALTGGLNACAIWHVFARRGLGFSANQGSPFSRSDGTEAFDLPPGIPSPCGGTVPMADLSVTKVVDNPTPNVGANVTFTVTLMNDGPDTATNVLVRDLLPSGFAFVSSSTTLGTYNSGIGVWTVPSITSGSSAMLTITATVLGSGNYNNIAEVIVSDQADPDSTPHNNIPSEDDQDNAQVTPQGQQCTIDDLIADVEALRDNGTLTTGQANGLLFWLNKAKVEIDHGQNSDAINSLNIFIAHIDFYVAQGILTPAQGQPLIDCANAIIGGLGGANKAAQEAEAGVPEVFSLEPNYPNPFNPTTEIGFQLPEAVHVHLAVYDVMGREVARLVDRSLEAGVHRVAFEASGLPSGTYFYRMVAGDFVQTQRMVLLK